MSAARTTQCLPTDSRANRYLSKQRAVNRQVPFSPLVSVPSSKLNHTYAKEESVYGKKKFMVPSTTAISQPDTNIELAISALTYHLESHLHKRKTSPSIEEDMTSYPQTQKFDLPSSSMCFSSLRSASVGGDPQDRASFSNVAGELSPRRERTSRYLSEGARKEIIARIDNGEKQVALAKEFNVSRAAISNLYKNRWEVLTRGVRDPTATHPKKSHKNASLRLASPMTPRDPVPPPMAHTSPITTQTIACPIVERAKTPSSFQDNSYPSWPGTQAEVSQLGHHNQMRHRNILHDDAAPHNRGNRDAMAVDSKRFIVHEASVYSYPCRNLVATLRDESISTVVFQQRAMRLARLLIEETLTCLPHDEEEITNKYGDLCHTMKALDASDFCAISMEDKGMVLLRAFSDISPVSPTGVISAEGNAAESKLLSPPHIFAQLPPSNPQQFVLLLDIECATGEKACAVLHHLVHDRNIPARNIYFATVISAFEGLQNVFRHFPDVSLVTAQVDTVLDDQQHIRPGIGDFVQRYWNVNS